MLLLDMLIVYYTATAPSLPLHSFDSQMGPLGPADCHLSLILPQP